jgi:hypothetical protein
LVSDIPAGDKKIANLFYSEWRVACSQRTLSVDRGKIIYTVQYTEVGMKPKATFVDSCMFTKRLHLRRVAIGQQTTDVDDLM